MPILEVEMAVFSAFAELGTPPCRCIWLMQRGKCSISPLVVSVSAFFCGNGKAFPFSPILALFPLLSNLIQKKFLDFDFPLNIFVSVSTFFAFFTCHFFGSIFSEHDAKKRQAWVNSSSFRWWAMRKSRWQVDYFHGRQFTKWFFDRSWNPFRSDDVSDTLHWKEGCIRYVYIICICITLTGVYISYVHAVYTLASYRIGMMQINKLIVFTSVVFPGPCMCAFRWNFWFCSPRPVKFWPVIFTT